VCSDDSGEGILNSNSGVIYELNGQQRKVKAITIKRENFNNKKSTKNLKNLKKKTKTQGVPPVFFGPFFFFCGIFMF